jgi:toxin CptA
VFDSVRSQRRIHACQGEIKLMTDSRLRWQKAEWEIVGMPWVINSGMLLRLRHPQTRRSQHLWVAADSMDAKEWRDLRRLVLNKPAQD